MIVRGFYYLCRMKLSVIVAVWNGKHTLRRCVDSLVGQLAGNYEIVLVDDGSTDGSTELCRQLTAGHKEVKAVLTPHQGLSHARNTGIAASDGDYITFADCDDEVAPESYKTAMDTLEKNRQVDVLEYPIHKGFPNRHAPTGKTLREEAFTTPHDYWVQTQGYRHCFACNKVFRRDLLERHPFKASNAFEDVALMTELLNEHICIATTTRGCYRYYDNEQGITHAADAAALKTLYSLSAESYETHSSSDFQRYLINIALDIYKLSGERNEMKRKSYFGSLKQIICNTLGINTLFAISKIYYQLCKSKK